MEFVVGSSMIAPRPNNGHLLLYTVCIRVAMGFLQPESSAFRIGVVDMPRVCWEDSQHAPNHRLEKQRHGKILFHLIITYSNTRSSGNTA